MIGPLHESRVSAGRLAAVPEAARPSTPVAAAQAAEATTPNDAIFNLLDPKQIGQSKANFSALLTSLQKDPDPKVQAQLAVFKEPAVSAFTARWQGDAGSSWDWKEQCKAGNVQASDDAIRLKIVAAVAELANILAAREADPIPAATTSQDQIAGGWALFGTKAIKSDVDYSVATITDTDRPFRDNAIQGRKIAMASLIFTACFNGPSLRLLDTEFYPPHIGTFLKADMSSGASLSAILSQMTHMLGKTELSHFNSQLGELCIACDLPDIGTMQELENDCQNMHRMVQDIKKNAPDKELASILCSSALTLELANTGDVIDTYNEAIRDTPPGRERDRLIAEKDEALAKYCYLDALRSQFLPEVFVTRGAFNVVCESQGGQKHQTAHEALETSIKTVAPDARAAALEAANQAASRETETRSSKSVQLATPQELLETIGENGAYFHHRPDLVDASKYGTRVYEPALVLVDKLILQERAKTPADEEFLASLHTFKKELTSKAEEMSVLESSKRGKFFQRAFKKIVAGISKEDFQAAVKPLAEGAPKLAHGTSISAADLVQQFTKKLDSILPGTKLVNPPMGSTPMLTSQAEVDALWRALLKSAEGTALASAQEGHTAKTIAATDAFFKRAKLGGAQFRVMEPGKRIESLQANLGATSLSPKMKAVADTVARAASAPLAATVLADAATQEVARMKTARGGLTSDEALFKKIQSEVRETIATVLVYSLKAGAIQAPEPLPKPLPDSMPRPATPQKPPPRLSVLLGESLNLTPLGTPHATPTALG